MLDRFERMLADFLGRSLLIAGVVAIVGWLLQAIWHSGFGHSAGSVLVRIALWLAAVCIVVVLVGLGAWSLLKGAYAKLATLLALLASGGLELLVKQEPRPLSPRTQFPLEVIGSGGLALLIRDEASAEAPGPQRAMVR